MQICLNAFSLGNIKTRERERESFKREQVGEVLLCKKNLPSLIFLCLGSSFIGHPNHLSSHSAVLIGKKEAKKSIWKPGSPVLCV